MDFHILIRAVKDKLGPKRKMSEKEAERANLKTELSESSKFSSAPFGSPLRKPMERSKPAKAGETDAVDEYMSDSDQRREAAKNLSKRKDLKKFEEGE